MGRQHKSMRDADAPIDDSGPDTTQAQCVEDGLVDPPASDHAGSEYMTEFVYTINGDAIDDLVDHAPGDEVVITAWPESNVDLVAGNGWDMGADGELLYSMTFEDAPDCSETSTQQDPPTTQDPTPTPPQVTPAPTGPAEPTTSADTPGSGELPATRADVESSLIAAGAMVLVGAGALLLRRLLNYRP